MHELPCRVEFRGGIAIVTPVGDSGSSDGTIPTLWKQLMGRTDVESAVVMLPDGWYAGPSARSDAMPQPDVPPLGPKSNGLLKPFGVGLLGDALDAALQLIGEADVVVAASGGHLADTSRDRGTVSVDAAALGPALPHGEVLRMALGGRESALSCARAVELGLIDAETETAEVEPELIRRIGRLTG